MAFDLREHLQKSLGTTTRVSRELGGGGMARVFVADDAEGRNRVVVKVLSPDLAIGVDGERFKREIRLASSLHHARIVPVIEAKNAGAVLFYTMPFIDGETLRSLLRTEQRLAIDSAVAIARDVAEALVYAHGKNVVHRDIKPDNILIERETKRAFVTDFGIARAIQQSSEISSVTSTGHTLGTPTYMSPEQAAAEGNINGASDVYSLGCVLFELLAGTPPFTGPNERTVIARHMTEPPPHIREIRPDIPPELERTLLRTLEKAPKMRLSAAQLIRALNGEIVPDAEPPSSGRWSVLHDAASRLRQLFQ
jgi:serine/threonine-protein kinase